MNEPGPRTSVHQFAPRSYYFFWEIGFHHSVFTVTGDGVIALDPISPEAAGHYRRAIESITDEPIKYIVYSHDHLDHISGAEVLSPNATIVSHVSVPQALISRRHTHIPMPEILVDAWDRIELGSASWDLRYMGANHGRSNIVVLNREERWAVAVDVVTPGHMPYRGFPYAEIPSFRTTLDRLAALDIDLITDGHSPPSDAIWIDRYRAYMDDLIVTTRDVRLTLDERTVLASLPPDAGGVIMTEEMIRRTAKEVVDRLRPKYGSWTGFERWGPLNADRAVLYLITGA